MGAKGSKSVSPHDDSPISRQEAQEAFEVLLTEIQSLRSEVQELRGGGGGGLRETVTETVHVPAPVAIPSPRTDSGKVTTSAASCDVMISLNCKTMLATAQRIEKFLESLGVRVWVCVEMVGGSQFRDDIVTAVDTCRVFLPLINEEWCTSKECKFEFNYAFRKNLTSHPEKPVILPICMPGLDWNGHKHVRALLASVNALVYSDDLEKELETLETLSVSLQHFGVSVCSQEDQSHQQAQCTKTEKRETAIPAPLPEDDPWDGWYKAVNRTTNSYDGNVTYSNNFLIRLTNGGMSSSGLASQAGTLHSNYDGVTCVISGTYSQGGEFHFSATYSNDTAEQYAGKLISKDGDIRCYGACSSGYAWFGYGRTSSGEYDMILRRLEGPELEAAKEALLQSGGEGDRGQPLEVAMRGIGRELRFEDTSFDADKRCDIASLREGRSKEGEEAPATFVLYPLAHSRQFAGAPLSVVWNRPPGATGEGDWIGVCEGGTTHLVTNDSWFRAWDARCQHGMVFWKELCPRSDRPGRYDIVYFTADNNEEVARQPLQFV